MNKDEVRQRIDIVGLIAQTVRLAKDGKNFKGLCPFHDDHNPSLVVYPDTRLWKCFGCGKEGDCFTWAMEQQKVDFPAALDTLRQQCGAAVVVKGASMRSGAGSGPTAAGSSGPSRVVKTTVWDIPDVEGNVIAQHVRYDHSDGAKRYSWRRGGQEGLAGLRTSDLPLYGLKHLFAMGAAAVEHIIIVEGEKAADALIKAGYAALGTVTGASSCPSREVFAPLVGLKARLHLWPDNDKAGQGHMTRNAAQLRSLGLDPYALSWPGAPAKGDAHDFLETGGDVRALLAASRPWPQNHAQAQQYGAESMGKRTPTTDTGNAELLAELYGGTIRFDHRRRRWLVWQDHHWKPDCDGYIGRLAIKAARHRFAEANRIEDSKEKGREAAWAVSSESRQKVDACIALAKSIKPVADKGDSWDCDLRLLGVPNGVVDLRTGELRGGRPGDHITMTTGVEFDPGAKCPRWDLFLQEVFGDGALIEWLQRAVGYSISGDTTEQCIFIGYGVGANGKGVFNGAINYVLRDYAYTAPFSTFELHQRASIPNDLAALEFKRFVSSSETNDNTRLNEARVKALSGCDPITARYLHQEFFTFWPHLKLWLFVNHKPKVLDDSCGFWRRVRLVPFARQFTKKAEDRRLGEKLRVEASGILAWMIRGCLEWQRRGLDPLPDCVQAATEEYRKESDPLANFIAGSCTEGAALTVQAAGLYKAYKAWADGQGMGPREVLTATAFGRRMGGRYHKSKSHGQIVYQGVDLSAGGGSGESSTLSIAENDVSPIEKSLREKNQENPPDYPPERENLPQLSLEITRGASFPSPDTPSGGNGHQSGDPGLTGVPAAEALRIWRSAGRPPIELSPGTTIRDLDKFLSKPPRNQAEIEAVKTWVKVHLSGR